MNNPLDNMPEVRKILYVIQWVYNGAAALLGAYFVVKQTAPDSLPEWYVLGLAIGPVLWTYLGLTASGNVTGKTPDGKNLDGEG